MISIARAIARMVGPSPASPVPLSPTTKPRPRSMFSSWPLMRQMFFNWVRAEAGATNSATMHRATIPRYQRGDFEWLCMARIPRVASDAAKWRYHSWPARSQILRRCSKRLPLVVPALEPAAGIAVADEAHLALFDPQVGDFVAANRAVRPDRRSPYDARQRLLPDLFVDADRAMCLDHQVAVRLNVDDVGRDPKRQCIPELHFRFGTELALQRAGDFRTAVALRRRKNILAVEFHPIRQDGFDVVRFAVFGVSLAEHARAVVHQHGDDVVDLELAHLNFGRDLLIHERAVFQRQRRSEEHTSELQSRLHL